LARIQSRWPVKFLVLILFLFGASAQSQSQPRRRAQSRIDRSNVIVRQMKKLILLSLAFLCAAPAAAQQKPERLRVATRLVRPCRPARV
jgi:hypothetical protein